jgi:6-phosphogluconolactonase (cycloisomerase 2 family)
MHTRTGKISASSVRAAALLALSGALLAACGGGGGDGGTGPAPNLSVGGTLSGLNGGSVVLRNNGANDLTVNANGGFTFSNQIANGASYSVTVATNPTNPAQTCTVANGSGTASANVSNIAVTCTTNTYTLGGTVSGLGTGKSLVLSNGTVTLTANANAAFTFASAIPSGTAFNITVSTQPVGQTCSVTNGSGTIAAAAVTNVVVACSTNSYTVSGTINGLLGSGLVLQNNSSNDQTPAAGATTFAFPAVAGNSPYVVAVASQPVNPSQTCSVVNGSGTGTGGNVTNVTVNCVINSFPVNVTVSGLTGSGLVLRNNGGNNLSVSANGTSTFSTQLLSGNSYNVTVFAQPTSPTQVCTPSGATGTVGNGPVTVTIACSTQSYTIGGTISGLAGTGLQIRNNGGDTQTIAANATTFSFPTQVASGGAYAVTVLTQPGTPVQSCVVANGSGTVVSGNVNNVTITCTTQSYTVGGTISGLTGTGLQIRNNAGDTQTIAANATTFSFPTQVASGAAYAVTVLTQPSTPVQSCTVANGSGTVGSGNVSNVAITCTITGFAVGGTVSGLVSGSTLVLQNNGGDNRSITVNGAFTFATNVNDGGAYAVTVLTQPSSAPARICEVISGGSGTVSGAAVTTVRVVCRARFAYMSNRLTDARITAFTLGANGLPAETNFVSVQSEFEDANPLNNPDPVADAWGVAVTPTGSHAFVTVDQENPTGSPPDTGGETTPGRIRVFPLNATTGALQSGPPATLVPNVAPIPNQPSQARTLLMHPDGDVLWVTDSGNGAIHTYAFDAGTSALTHVGQVQVLGLSGVVIDPTATWFFAGNYDNGEVWTHRIQSDGTLLIGPQNDVGPDIGRIAMAVSTQASQYLIVSHAGNQTVASYAINSVNGALTLVNSLSTNEGPVTLQHVALVVDPTGTRLYAARGDGVIVAYTIATNGTLTQGVTYTRATPTTGNEFQISMDSSGQYIYHLSATDGTMAVFRINATTGALTEVVGSPVTVTPAGPNAVALLP